MNKAIVLLVFVAGIALVEPHGFVRVPISRTSIFRESSWGASQPFWWDDTGVWCGNVQQNLQYSTCGVCGDAPGNTHAARGGRYDKAIITGSYAPGSIADIIVEMTANHRGHMEFHLSTAANEAAGSFQQLNIVGGDREIRSGNMMCVGGDHQNGPVNVRVQLPAGVTCARCTLRWTYRTAYPPAADACWDPNPAQTFRNCVDIRIG